MCRMEPISHWGLRARMCKLWHIYIVIWYMVNIFFSQRRANAKCFYTYIFDTFTDISLYEGQWVSALIVSSWRKLTDMQILDEYMGKLDGFNKKTLPRRGYLSGQDERYRTRFWMQTSVFVKKAPLESRSGKSPGYLHAWVLQAEKESKAFRANPDRPRVWVKDGKNTLPIGDKEPGSLQRGDVVAVSFTITYHITSSNWFAQFHPADIVVLKAGDGDRTDYGAPEIGLYGRPPPTMMEDDGDSSKWGYC